MAIFHSYVSLPEGTYLCIYVCMYVRTYVCMYVYPIESDNIQNIYLKTFMYVLESWIV